MGSIPTTGSVLSFASDFTGSNGVTAWPSAISIPNDPAGRFIVVFSDQRLATSTKIVGRVVTWDGTPNGFTFGTPTSSSFAVGLNSPNRIYHVSESRYGVSFYYYSYNGWVHEQSLELTSSGTGSVNWITTVPYNSWTYYYPSDATVINSSSYIVGGWGLNSGYGSYGKTMDFTSSVSPVGKVSTAPVTSTSDGVRIVKLDEDEFYTCGWRQTPEVQNYIVSYTASSNTINKTGVFYGTNLNVTSYHKSVDLYAFHKDLIFQTETTNSTGWPTDYGGANGYFLRRTSGATSLSTVGPLQRIISSSAGVALWQGCRLVPLNETHHTFALVGRESTGTWLTFRKFRLHADPWGNGIYSASMLSEMLQKTTNLNAFDAVRLDDDSIAIVWEYTNTHSIMSVKFNAGNGTEIPEPFRIKNVTQLIGVGSVGCQ